MSAPAGQPGGILARDLLTAAALAALLVAVFTVFNERLLHGFSGSEVLILEGGAIVLIGFLVARAVTNATNAVLQRHGLVPRGHAVRLFLNLLIAAAVVLGLFRLAGVSAESIFIGAGFTGIVLGLASQTVLSNVFAGILLVFADPFRPGDRVGFVASQYGKIAPSYPHESIVPLYSGTVEDVGLTYTQIRLDSGGLAKVPNGIVIQAMVLLPEGPYVHRVRMTFPQTVGLARVEAALADVAQAFPASFAGAPPPRLEAADISATTWDGVVTVWTTVRDPAAVYDRVARAVLARLAAPAA
jgi:small-conductance mechanosensitive channel